MDLPLVQTLAATPPPARPSAATTLAPSPAGEAFDALLDRASTEAAGSEELDEAPLFVVAPVIEWLPDCVIRTPLDPESKASVPAAGDAAITSAGPAPQDVASGAAAEPQPANEALAARLAAEAVPGESDRGAEPLSGDAKVAPASGDPSLDQRATNEPKTSSPSQPDAARPTTLAAARSAAAAISNVGPAPSEAKTPTRTDKSAERATADGILQQALDSRAAPTVPAAESTANAGVPQTATGLQETQVMSIAARAAVDQPSAFEPPSADVSVTPSASAVRQAIEAFARAEGHGGQSAGSETGERGSADQRPAHHSTGRGSFGDVAAASSVTAPVVEQAIDGPPTGAEAPDTGDRAVPDLTPQFVRSMQLQWRQGLGEARLELQPEHLGPVTIELQVGPEGVDATLTSESAVVRGWMEAHEAELRSGLAGQGLMLASLTVTADPQEQRRRQAARDVPPQKESRRADPSPETWQTELTAKLQ